MTMCVQYSSVSNPKRLGYDCLCSKAIGLEPTTKVRKMPDTHSVTVTSSSVFLGKLYHSAVVLQDTQLLVTSNIIKFLLLSYVCLVIINNVGKNPRNTTCQQEVIWRNH